MNMTYLHHSGFQIETKHSVLLLITTPRTGCLTE